MKLKQIMVLFFTIIIIANQFAFAARFGGMKNRGMQRNYNHQYNYQRNNTFNQHEAPITNNNISNNQNSKSPGMRATTAAALGAAAGVAGGYMLGKSMSDNSNNNTTKQNTSDLVTNNPAISTNSTNQFPWGIIGILFMLLVLGLMFFKKKTSPQFQSSNNNNKLVIPNINSNIVTNSQTTVNISNKDSNTQTISDRMPDGVENIYFLRQAKGMFLHIQSMNNQENLSEIAKYLTPELYNEVQNDIKNNDSIADFPVLNCKLLNASIENDQLIASVIFNGLVSENPNDTPKPFNEVWNFIKPDIKVNKWFVSGIQQQTN